LGFPNINQKEIQLLGDLSMHQSNAMKLVPLATALATALAAASATASAQCDRESRVV
jgi:hypothetical protein